MYLCRPFRPWPNQKQLLKTQLEGVHVGGHGTLSLRKFCGKIFSVIVMHGFILVVQGKVHLHWHVVGLKVLC